ncbi:CoA transferase [Streptomyces sp. SID10853]|uniref:CaiB/BaiF CoA transferase family protein n=1 Tax=Streptomyces sp. SID10853 TaxID=2706028 RepID=UPI0013C196B3|nr:CoA transferase [Streptomyces sp. SID10853]NDZ77899.1 CoA transferase [Streptomyces sp. SID10853]
MPALSGIRVLDLSRVLAGPFCTSLLADIGADVVKVEPPGGDDTRRLGPFAKDVSVYFAMLNRDKRSIALDLKDPADLETLWSLAAHADVLVENFRPGVADRLGIGAAALLAHNPRLVYASISGFGQSGAMSGRPAYDLIIQAMSGIMETTGSPDGEPTKVGESIADLQAGLYGSWAICAALVERARTGRGQHLDIAMLDAMVSLQLTGASLLAADGAPPTRVGNRHPVSTPFGVYRAADAPVVLAAANDRTFHRLLDLIGRPELAEHPVYRTDEARTAHEPEVRATIESWTRQHSAAEIVALAGEQGVPAGPVQDLQQAIDSVRPRGVTGGFLHPSLEGMTALRQPVVFQGASGAAPSSTPDLDAHHEEIIRDWTGG